MDREIFSDIEDILRGKTGKNLEMGIITAENEMGKELPDVINNQRNEQLYKDLNNVPGSDIYRIQGNFGGISENSFLVVRVSFNKLKELAGKYKQEAFIYGTGREDDMSFHYMEVNNQNDSDNFDYKSVQTRETFMYKPNAKENYSSYKGIKFLIPFFDNEYNDTGWEDLSPNERGEGIEDNEDGIEESKINKIKKLIGNNNNLNEIKKDWEVDVSKARALPLDIIDKIKSAVVRNPKQISDLEQFYDLRIKIDKLNNKIIIIRGNLKVTESYIKRISKIVESLKIKEEKVKIKVKHEDLLEVPRGKKFWNLSLNHYKKLVDRKGYAKVIRALNNIKVWNRKDDPEISKKADEIMIKLKKEFRPKED